MDPWTLWIALYGAALATATFLWNVWNARSDRREKLTVTLTADWSGETRLVAQVTNVSATRAVEVRSIDFDGVPAECPIELSWPRLPHRLQPNETVDFAFALGKPIPDRIGGFTRDPRSAVKQIADTLRGVTAVDSKGRRHRASKKTITEVLTALARAAEEFQVTGSTKGEGS